jgi:hypothetical protein
VIVKMLKQKGNLQELVQFRCTGNQQQGQGKYHYIFHRFQKLKITFILHCLKLIFISQLLIIVKILIQAKIQSWWHGAYFLTQILYLSRLKKFPWAKINLRFLTVTLAGSVSIIGY